MDEEIRQLLASLQIDEVSEGNVLSKTAPSIAADTAESVSVKKAWRKIMLLAGIFCTFVCGVYYFLPFEKEPLRRVVHSYELPETVFTRAPFIATTKTGWSVNDLNGTCIDNGPSAVFSNQLELMRACGVRKATLEGLRSDIDHLLLALTRTPDVAIKDSLSKAVVRFQEADVLLTNEIIEFIASKKTSCQKDEAERFEETLALAGLKTGLREYQHMGEKIRTTGSVIEQLLTQLRDENDIVHLAALAKTTFHFLESARTDYIVPMFVNVEEKHREALLLTQASFHRLVYELPENPWPRRASIEERKALSELRWYLPSIEEKYWARFDGALNEVGAASVTVVSASNHMGIDGFLACSTRMLLPREGIVAG